VTFGAGLSTTGTSYLSNISNLINATNLNNVGNIIQSHYDPDTYYYSEYENNRINSFTCTGLAIVFTFGVITGLSTVLIPSLVYLFGSDNLMPFRGTTTGILQSYEETAANTFNAGVNQVLVGTGGFPPIGWFNADVLAPTSATYMSAGMRVNTIFENNKNTYLYTMEIGQVTQRNLPDTMIGITTETGTIGDIKTIELRNAIDTTQFTDLTPGSQYYMLNGFFTTTPAGVPLGISLAVDRMWIYPVTDNQFSLPPLDAFTNDVYAALDQTLDGTWLLIERDGVTNDYRLFLLSTDTEGNVLLLDSDTITQDFGGDTPVLYASRKIYTWSVHNTGTGVMIYTTGDNIQTAVY
jgi:hypothetical protein